MLKVKGDTPLVQIARRAATRVDRLRWDPLLAIDDRGRLEGIVPVARILTALADDAERVETSLQFRNRS